MFHCRTFCVSLQEVLCVTVRRSVCHCRKFCVLLVVSLQEVRRSVCHCRKFCASLYDVLCVTVGSCVSL